MATKRQKRPQEPRCQTRPLDKPTVPAAWQRWWIPGLMILALSLFFGQLLFGRQVFSSPDAQAPQGFAVYAEAARQAGGDTPLWNPFVFCGMPSFGSLAYNPGIYPPDWLLAPLGRAAPPMLWLVIYYMIGALGLYALLVERGVTRGAAAVAGLMFALTPNLIAVGAHGHGSQLVCSGWMPVVLWLTHRYLDRGGLENLAVLGAALGCQLLRGHVQIAYYTWLATAIYVAVFVWGRRRQPSTRSPIIRRAALGVPAALALALGLAAVLVLPVLNYAPQSIRGGGATGGADFDYATGWSLGIGELVTMVVPSAYGFGGPTYFGGMPFTDYPNAYMGVVPLTLAVLGLMSRRRLGVFVLLALVSLVVALGKHTPVYQWLYDVLPFFKKFRVPVMIVVVAHLGLAALAGFGIDVVRSATRGRRWRQLVWVALAALVGAFVLGGPLKSAQARRFLESPRVAAVVHSGRAPVGDLETLAENGALATHRDLMKNLALVAAVGGVGWWVASRRRLAWVAPAACLALFALDVVPIDWRLMQPMIHPEHVLKQVVEPDALAEFLRQPDEPPFRVFPLEEFAQNRFATFGIRSVGGYHAAKPRAYQEFMTAIGLDSRQVFASEAGLRWLDFLGVRYLLTAAQVPESERFGLALGGATRAYENHQALPLVFCVDEVVVEPAGAATLQRLATPSFNPHRQAVVSDDVGKLEAVGQARVVSAALNSFTFELESAGRTLAVVSESYNPDWRVRVDGELAALVRVNHAFRGVVVEAGRHQVEMEFADRSVKTGRRVSWATALVCLALVLAGTVYQRRQCGAE